jgi:hypothetical protein
MKINIKRTIIITIIIIAVIIPLWQLCSVRKWFRFDWSLDETQIMVQENHKAMYFLGYDMSFWGPNYQAHAEVLLDDKYETYTLYYISFAWDDGRIGYIINKKFNLDYDSSRVRVFNSDEEFFNHWGIDIAEVDKRAGADKWYEIDYLEGFLMIDFSKIFKGKKIGKSFRCKITVKFSFDDEYPMILSYCSNILVDRYSYLGLVNLIYSTY